MSLSRGLSFRRNCTRQTVPRQHATTLVVYARDLVGPSQILFGTDFPPGGTNLAVAQAVAALGFFDDRALRAIERDNAVKLLPRLEASGR